MASPADEDGSWTLFTLDVKSLRQNGPSCGLVALRMASVFVCSKETGGENVPSVQDILKVATEKGFSRKGEIFSCQHLAALGREVCNVSADVIEDPSTELICSAISYGKPVLIAYDADKDNSPCLLQGARAHWAVICGVALPSTAGLSDRLGPLLEKVKEVEQGRTKLECCKQSSPFTEEGRGVCCCCTWCSGTSLGTPREKADNRVMGICLHGKSSRLNFWDLESLLASNANLAQPRSDLSRVEMVVPEGLDGLKCKMIVISM
mmetsp:Transcript_17881/g.58777  ORF Transcript_17881/g.58777 Transcript_17881/m.58777 type:complete len:264 (-) Transcript_17881:143-934(-)